MRKKGEHFFLPFMFLIQKLIQDFMQKIKEKSLKRRCKAFGFLRRKWLNAYTECIDVNSKKLHNAAQSNH